MYVDIPRDRHVPTRSQRIHTNPAYGHSHAYTRELQAQFWMSCLAVCGQHNATTLQHTCAAPPECNPTFLAASTQCASSYILVYVCLAFGLPQCTTISVSLMAPWPLDWRVPCNSSASGSYELCPPNSHTCSTLSWDADRQDNTRHRCQLRAWKGDSTAAVAAGRSCHHAVPQLKQVQHRSR
jgi:hypothetical protein